MNLTMNSSILIGLHTCLQVKIIKSVKWHFKCIQTCPYFGQICLLPVHSGMNMWTCQKLFLLYICICNVLHNFNFLFRFLLSQLFPFCFIYSKIAFIESVINQNTWKLYPWSLLKDYKHHLREWKLWKSAFFRASWVTVSMWEKVFSWVETVFLRI